MAGPLKSITRYSSLTQGVTLFFAYLMTAMLGLKLGAVSGFATFVWPPTGIALSALFLFGYRLWPAIMAAAFLVNYLTGAPIPVALAIGVGNTIEPMVGCYLLRSTGFQSSLGRIQDVIKFAALAAIGSTFFSAFIGVSSLWLGGIVPLSAFRNTFVSWWLGDIMGNLTLTPFLLVWSSPPLRKMASIRKTLELLLLILLTLTICGTVFFNFPALTLERLHGAYLIFPPLLWAAARFAQPGAVILNLFIAIVSVWGTAVGHGPFISPDLSERLYHLQTFLGVFTLTSLFLGAAIAELRKARDEMAELAQVRKEAIMTRDEFLSVASHELKTPITSLYLQLQLLQNLAKKIEPELAMGPDQAFSYCHKIIQGIDKSVQANTRVLNLLDDLLNLSQIRSGKLRIRKKTCDLIQVTQSALELLSGDAEKRGVTVIFKKSVPSLEGYWDPVRIEQVVLNLLSNALKYGDNKPIEIRIEKHSSDQVAVIKVVDSGIGIPAEMIPKLFQRFERGLPPSKISGLGLGLLYLQTDYPSPWRHD